MKLINLTFVAVCLMTAGNAHGFCPVGVGIWHENLIPIEVRLDKTLFEPAPIGLVCDGQCPGPDGVQALVRDVLHEFYNAAGSRLRFELSPQNIDLNGQSYSPERLVIRAVNENCRARAWAEWWDMIDHEQNQPTQGKDGFTDTAVVSICTEPGYIWSPSDDGLTENLDTMLKHELMHTLDFHHPHQAGCDPTTPSVLSYSTQQTHLYADDINALQKRYGPRLDRTARSVHSTDQLTWTAGPTDAAASNTGRGAMTACDNQTTSRTPLAYVLDTAAVIRIANVDPASWDPGVVLSIIPQTQYRAGLSCESDDRQRVFFLGDYEHDDFGRQTVKFLDFSESDGIGDAEIFADVSNKTKQPGIDGSYDEASGRHIAIWRANSGQIVSKVDGGPLSFFNNPRDESPLRAADPPSIACGHPRVLGEWNCMVVWSDVDWYRVWKWAPAKVVSHPFFGPRLNLGIIRSQGYLAQGTPSVAVVNYGEFPWQTAFHQGGRTTYVFRKTANPQAVWQNERSFSFDGAVVSPAMGSAFLRNPNRRSAVVVLSSSH